MSSTGCMEWVFEMTALVTWVLATAVLALREVLAVTAALEVTAVMAALATGELATSKVACRVGSCFCCWHVFCPRRGGCCFYR